jgi:hypothetical protein
MWLTQSTSGVHVRGLRQLPMIFDGRLPSADLVIESSDAAPRQCSLSRGCCPILGAHSRLRLDEASIDADVAPAHENAAKIRPWSDVSLITRGRVVY